MARNKFKMGVRLYSILFAIALSLTILLGPSSLLTAQLPSDIQALKAEIKQHAERDAKEGKKKTEWIVDYYKDNQFGLNSIQIRDIYEAEFDRLKKPNHPIAEFISKHFPWLLAFGGIFAASFREKLGKQVSKLWDWLFNRLAGNALFWNQALRRYRKRIIEEHEELFIPFRPHRPLAMNQIYVALRVSGGQSEASTAGSNTEIDSNQAVKDYQRLMVTGAAGSGKTMLLKYLLLSYAQGQLLLPERPILVHLELYRLSEAGLTQEKLINELVKAFARYGWPNADGFVKQSLKRGKLMLLLDGLDEVNSNERSHVAKQLKDFLQTYPNCRAVITCRTMVYDGSLNPPVADQLLNVVEFTDQQVRLFLMAWEDQMPPERSLEQLLQTLCARPRIMALARNPLLLTIIAFLYTDTPFELPYSRAEFYQESTRFLLGQWHREHNQFKTNEKQIVLQHLALYNQTNGDSVYRDRRSLDYQTVLDQIQAVLPEINRNPESDARPLLDEMVDRSGLFLRLDGGERYQFSHLTLQEYFAAEALRENESDLLKRFQDDPAAWREVLKLWCGLSNDSTNVIDTVFQVAPIVAFECLADAVKVDNRVADKIIDHFKKLLYKAATDDTLAQAFGTVASSSRNRNQALFHFLVETLDANESSPNTQNLEQRQGAVNALSYTNQPNAAKELARHYGTPDLNLRESLIQMGNLAVPELQQLTNNSQYWSEAIADLAAIKTPEAALVLVPLLWDAREEKANQAAWHLSELISQTSVEESLRHFNLTDKERQAEILDWVWIPFDSNDIQNSALPIIMGRVAFLLSRTSSNRIPKERFNADPRIVIPLCGIEIRDQVHLPESLSNQAQFLLEQPDFSPELEELAHKEVDDLLANTPEELWKFLFLSLPVRKQLDMLARLTQAALPPEQKDWLTLDEKVIYDFQNGSHYRTVLFRGGLKSF